MPISPPQGDLARTTSQEPDSDWPTLIEIVAYWSKDGSRKGRRRSIEIDANQFFGRGHYGAPMPAEALMAAVERLRRQGGGK